jgi:hypothetical protein
VFFVLLKDGIEIGGTSISIFVGRSCTNTYVFFLLARGVLRACCWWW